jgi:D-aminoacyl-tRNA deacylase
MRAVIQRVSEASVSIEGEPVGQIDAGLLIFVGVEDADSHEDGEWLARKAVNMRIFEDDEGKMNASLLDLHRQALVVSQFTLHASTKKGNRPSFIRAARPDHSEPLYLGFIENLEKLTGKKCAEGRFGANMQVSLVNDGPVTIIIDSKARE